jgi:DNA-directed RNA polymerase subunit RPC12/RpoP
MVRAVKPGDTVESVIVDGNAVAGMLAEVLRSDATLLQLTCGTCGSRSILAEALVELDEVGAIVRCRACTHTMLTLLRKPDGVTLRIGKLELALPRTDA